MDVNVTKGILFICLVRLVIIDILKFVVTWYFSELCKKNEDEKTWFSISMIKILRFFIK